MIKQKLTLPTDQLWRYSALIAKQGDNKARYFSVTMTVNGKAIELTDGDTVRINITRSDGAAKAYAGTVENGKAILPLPLWATEIADATIKCDVSATIANADGNGNSGTISTATFNVYIQPSNCSDSNISTDDSYTVLEQLILQVQSLETAAANEDSRIAAEKKRVEAENARVTAETARAKAETARATAETARAKAEETRESNETTRKSNETTRKSNETKRATAETARAEAETARKSNEETRKSNETARQSAETTRQNNESARQTEYEELTDKYNSAINNINNATEAASEIKALYAKMNVTFYSDENGDVWIDDVESSES